MTLMTQYRHNETHFLRNTGINVYYFTVFYYSICCPASLYSVYFLSIMYRKSIAASSLLLVPFNVLGRRLQKKEARSPFKNYLSA